MDLKFSISLSGCINNSPGLFGDVFHETTGVCCQHVLWSIRKQFPPSQQYYSFATLGKNVDKLEIKSRFSWKWHLIIIQINKKSDYDTYIECIALFLDFLDYTFPNQNYFQWVHILELYKKKYSPYNAYNQLMLDIALVLLTTYLCSPQLEQLKWTVEVLGFFLGL